MGDGMQQTDGRRLAVPRHQQRELQHEHVHTPYNISKISTTHSHSLACCWPSTCSLRRGVASTERHGGRVKHLRILKRNELRFAWACIATVVLVPVAVARPLPQRLTSWPTIAPRTASSRACVKAAHEARCKACQWLDNSFKCGLAPGTAMIALLCPGMVKCVFGTACTMPTTSEQLRSTFRPRTIQHSTFSATGGRIRPLRSAGA